ncbi:hypothetical protein P8C59_008920 [Phyllachora maydis]|uniref:Uncharacterized protein n=1 Tax=Phyllachora maydis TaxID=1825666 RepID=A0AAD9IDE4_9PEZI|nr:hypothetical protein P8C59_008920 [Phyllachora maydis]
MKVDGQRRVPYCVLRRRYTVAALLALAAATVEAHYTFPCLIVDGQSTGDWLYVRKTVHWQDNGFVHIGLHASQNQA